ncbi:MAG TPA: NUDIX hydrolase [Thermoanaerobaculia bacterium]|nr:NUDIX hydrolase [Thermoanaerobaculia bacterium]
MAEVVEAVPAASVIVLREAPLEVLLLRRHEKSSFVPDAWVFPGGMMEEEDGGDFRVTAARELREETGIAVDAQTLVATSRWITPVGLPKRFDTWFFLAKVEHDVAITVQQSELVEALWITPAGALARKDLKMVFPTIKNLEALTAFASADALIDSRRGAIIEAIQPVLAGGRPTLP